MPSLKVRMEYATIDQVACSFDTESDRIRRLICCIEDSLQVLKAGAWAGDNADRFFQSIDSDVLPGIMRLQQALVEASCATQNLVRLFEAGEEEAAQCMRGIEDAHKPGETAKLGSGGGDGGGLTGNDVASDDVENVTTDSEADQAALAQLSAIEGEYGVAIAFPTSEQNDMSPLPGDAIPDPAKPGLRSVTGADTGTLAVVEQQLATLRAYGIDLTQTGDAHWTPEEIAQIHAAVTDMGNEAYNRAVALELIERGQVTPAQAFAAVYTDGENGLTFERNADNRHGGGSEGAYAWNSQGTITMYDAAYYGQQATGTGAQRGVYFTPYLLLQHEISHQINYMYTIGGDTPATVYGESFTFVEGSGYAYTFTEDHRFAYRNGEGDLVVGSVAAGDTIYLPTTDSGYDYRARTAAVGDDPEALAYNAAEEVTDGQVAEVAPYGAYTYAGIGSYQDEVFGRARREVNQAIFDEVLTQIDWENID